MDRKDAHVGQKVMFGRRNGEMTLATIVKINQKNFKVKTLEGRGTKKNYKVGSLGTVSPSLCTPIVSEKKVERRVQTPKKKVSTPLSTKGSRAVTAAKAAEKALRAACSLSNPPTYIKASRRYLDGTTVRKSGTEYDGQRQKLYDSETGVPLGKQFKDIEKAQKFVDKVLDSAWFNRRFDLTDVRLEMTQGWTKSYCRPSQKLIRLLDCHLNERIVLHELAHAIVPKPHSHHGRLFSAIYLDLVRHFIGEDAYDALLKGYRRENVKYQPHRKVKR